MPLPPPTALRTRMHVRNVQLDGYKRNDGCWDIEARLRDVKDHDYPLSSGLRKQGEAVHDMWVRVTIDAQMNILGRCCQRRRHAVCRLLRSDRPRITRS
jgi:hypothetical protein